MHQSTLGRHQLWYAVLLPTESTNVKCEYKFKVPQPGSLHFLWELAFSRTTHPPHSSMSNLIQGNFVNGASFTRSPSRSTFPALVGIRIPTAITLLTKGTREGPLLNSSFFCVFRAPIHFFSCFFRQFHNSDSSFQGIL